MVQRFSALTHLFLKFSDSDQVTAKALSNFPVTLSQLPALQALDLTISSAVNTRAFFEMISLCLENIKELVSFAIKT